MGEFNNSVELYVFRRARTSRDGLTSAGAPCDCAYDSRTDLWPANPSPARCLPTPIPRLSGPVGATYPDVMFRATLDEPCNRGALYIGGVDARTAGASIEFGIKIAAGLPFVEDDVRQILTTLPTTTTGGLIYTWVSIPLFSSITLRARTAAGRPAPIGVQLVLYLDRVPASAFAQAFGAFSVVDP